jgi:hypothetical protein
VTADPQPVPDAALTAALGGYYGHPTAITAADPDVIDGLTAAIMAVAAAIERAFGPFHDDDTDPYAPDVVRWLRGQCIRCGRGLDESCGVLHMFRAVGTS